MADESTANVSGPTSTVAEGKGKEKAPIVQDMSMDEEGESSEGEEGAEDEVCLANLLITFTTCAIHCRGRAC